MSQTPATLTTVTACCDLIERMFQRCLNKIEFTSNENFSTLSEAADILARLTAVRKSLIHLSERPSPPKPESAVNAGARASARDNTPDLPSPDTDPVVPQLPSVHPIQQTREIREIPAMPLDRIEPALNRIATDLTDLSRAARFPQPQNQPSNNGHPSDTPEYPSCELRSPERHNHPSNDTHPSISRPAATPPHNTS